MHAYVSAFDNPSHSPKLFSHMDITVREISPTDAETRRLFKRLDLHNTAYCTPEECHLTQPEELIQADSILLGIFCDNTLCGMGALKFFDDYAEVSRMFVCEEHRGRGLAARILDALTQEAARRGKAFLRLETSDRFEHAYRLYLKYGFSLREPFGEYVHATHQHTYMEKRIV